MSQKYVIVHFIELAKVPEEFSAKEWPLHITLLSNFSIPCPLQMLEIELAAYASRAKPFSVTAAGEAMFGPNKSVAVSLIRPDKPILDMHTHLLSITTSLGAGYDEFGFVGDGFRPHATVQVKSRLANKQEVTLDNFTLVDMYPNENINSRRIIKTYALEGLPSSRLNPALSRL